ALLLPGSSSSYRKLLAYPLSFSYPVFMFNAPPTTAIYTLSLHDALPISGDLRRGLWLADGRRRPDRDRDAARERRRGRGEDRHRRARPLRRLGRGRLPPPSRRLTARDRAPVGPSFVAVRPVPAARSVVGRLNCPRAARVRAQRPAPGGAGRG